MNPDILKNKTTEELESLLEATMGLFQLCNDLLDFLKIEIPETNILGVSVEAGPLVRSENSQNRFLDEYNEMMEAIKILTEAQTNSN